MQALKIIFQVLLRGFATAATQREQAAAGLRRALSDLSR
jgi:hypothetical protein